MISVQSCLAFMLTFLFFGLLVGYVVGMVLEHNLWLDAICARERILKSRVEETDDAD